MASVVSEISVHLYVFGPRPLLKSLFSYCCNYLRKLGLISRSYLLEFKNSSVFNMLHRYLLITYAAMTKQALFWAFSLLTRTLSWFSRASFIKLKTSSGIFSASSKRICFSSSYQFKVRYWTPMVSQWFVSCIPAVLTILCTLFEIKNSRSYKKSKNETYV